MPHQCTNCDHVFPDGSKEMLSGCPDCGGNKFQFKQGSVDDITDAPDDPAARQAAADHSATHQPPSEDTAANSATPSAANVDSPDENPTGDRESTSETDPQPPDSPPTTVDPNSTAEATDDSGADSGDAELMESNRTQDGESPAQSTARSDIVSDDELPDTPPAAQSPTGPDSDTAPDAPDSANEAGSSGLDQLRQELNDQFESIRIVSPGQYELNLMELYDRNEYIISLREDGRYVIEVPDSWGTDEPN